MKQESVFKKRVGESIIERGIFRSIFVAFKLFLEYFYYKLFKQRDFLFQGKKLKYFYYPYNATWRNERAIEIPIISYFLKRYNQKRILEVGNVLSHYFPINHDVLDKYEKGVGVINEDVISFKSKEKYNLIISISTLEHVGWDEIPKEPKKILKAIKNLKRGLKENGKMIVTIPFGHNLEMDNMIKTGKIKFKEQHFFKRISKDNLWKEVNLKEVMNARYNKPFPFANVIVIGIS